MSSLLLGSAPAMALAPFFAVEDIRACAPISCAARDAFSKDSLWRQMLVCHYSPALQRLRQILESLDTVLPSNEDPTEWYQALLSEIPGARQVYASLAATSCQPFVLQPRARLNLEIHELRDWNKHSQTLLLLRQAEVLAVALRQQEALQRLRADMSPETLELIALQALVAGGGKVELGRTNFDLHGMAWSPDLEQELMQILARRAEGRRSWLRQQRDFLLQDLTFNWN